jgi:hypothetical protein
MVSSVSEIFMASTGQSKAPGARPSPIRPGATPRQDKSEDTDSPKVPRRAHTFQNGTAVEATASRSKEMNADVPESPDAFETTDNDEVVEHPRASVDLDELPIELISLTDR